MKVISFLSDFGLSDSYVGEVKAVLSRVGSAAIVDVTHLIPAHQVEWGAFQLLRAYSHFPKGTWHLAVVDPGVGSERRAIYVQTKEHHFVGPDNGLLKWAVEHAQARDKKPAKVFEIAVPKGVGPTFHGRDVFAPFIVDSLKKTRKLKPLKTPLVGRGFPVASQVGRQWTGEVVMADVYGNLITSVPVQDEIASGEIRGRKLMPAGNYGEIVSGEAALIKGSSGYWEIACREASAAQRLGAKIGTPVTLSRV